MKKENLQGSRLKPKCGCCHDLAWHPLHCSFNACHTDDLKIKSHVYSSLRSHGLMSNYRPPTKLREGNVLAISVILLRRGRGESSHVTITHAILKLTSFNRSLDLAIRCHERGGEGAWLGFCLGLCLECFLALDLTVLPSLPN